MDALTAMKQALEALETMKGSEAAVALRTDIAAPTKVGSGDTACHECGFTHGFHYWSCINYSIDDETGQPL